MAGRETVASPIPKDWYAPIRLLTATILVLAALLVLASAAAGATLFAAPAKHVLRAKGYGHLHVFCSRKGRCHWRGVRAGRACTGTIMVRQRGLRWRTRISGVRCRTATGGVTGTAGTGTGPSMPGHPSCGGESPPKEGGGTWTCSFDDEFSSATGDASSLNRSWWTPQVTATSGYVTGPVTDRACYVDSPNNVSVSGGALHLTVRKESRSTTCGLSILPTPYTSGMVSTIYSFHQTYGRFEVRALLPQTTVRGLQETLWLWPVNDRLYGRWPASGEVDFSEFYSQYSSLDIPYIHYNYDAVNQETNKNVVTKNCQISLYQYNDYAVTWSPGSFQITVNGNTCLTDNYAPNGGLTSPEPFSQPFFISLTQALGIGSNSFAPSTTPLPASTSIDYVRVWK